jgi:hypothetical protein
MKQRAGDTYVAYETVDFRPADGWKALYHGKDPGQPLIVPVAGWLIQVQNERNSRDDRSVRGQDPLTERRRRVVAAVAEGVELLGADASNFWLLLPPGEEGPSADAAREAWEAWDGKPGKV